MKYFWVQMENVTGRGEKGGVGGINNYNNNNETLSVYAKNRHTDAGVGKMAYIPRRCVWVRAPLPPAKPRHSTASAPSCSGSVVAAPAASPPPCHV